MLARKGLAPILERGAGEVKAALQEFKTLYKASIQEGGGEDALLCLASFLRKGVNGVPANPCLAVEQYEKAIAEDAFIRTMYRMERPMQTAGGAGVERARKIAGRAMRSGEAPQHIEYLQRLLKRFKNSDGGFPVSREFADENEFYVNNSELDLTGES